MPTLIQAASQADVVKVQIDPNYTNEAIALLPGERDRAQTDQADPSVGQRPGRTRPSHGLQANRCRATEPHDHGRNRQALPL